MPKYKLNYLGKTYEAQTKNELYEKMKDFNVSKARVNKLLKNKDTGLYVIQDGINVSKLDIRQDIKPLLIRDFNIPRDKIDDKKLSKVIKHNNIKISRNIPKDADIMNADIHITMLLQYSREIEERKMTRRLNDIENTKEAIDAFVRRQVLDYVVGDVSIIREVSYTVKSIFNNAKYKMVDMKLRDRKPLKLYNEDIEMIETENNCVIEYLLKNYKKISAKKIKALDDNGVSPIQLKKFCETYDIKFRCYDITKNLISSYNPQKNKRAYKKMIIVAFNNHIYNIKNKYIHSFKKEKEVIYSETIEDDLIKYVEDGNYPLDVSIDKNSKDMSVLSYETKDKIFTSNKDYNKIKILFNKLGISDKLHPNIKISSIGNYLYNLYVKENIKSVWINHDEFKKDGYAYKNENLNYNEFTDNITTLDKNKCYSYVLKNLPYLISVDFKKDKRKTKIKEIIDHYLYIVEPKHESILIPHTNVYAGYHVKYALKEGLELTIKEEISTTKHDNYFSQLVDDVYKYTDETTAKNIINFMIGKMQTRTEGHTINKFVKIANKDETDRTDGFNLKLTDDYNIFYKYVDKPPSIYTMKPIAFQIKDAGRVLMYEKMKSLKIDPAKIIQCKTDSFSFINNENIKYTTSKHFNGWKTEQFQEYCDTTYQNKDLSFKMDCISDKTKLITGNAGNGKTYYIINTLLKDKTDYKVLTPSHATLRQYKKKKLVCDVIQKYSYLNQIPEEEHIYIDEIGMCDSKAWDLIIKCIYANKTVYALGDFTQLKPVKCDNAFDNELLIDSLFMEKEIKNENWRNNFKESFYNKLRTTKDKKYLLEKINKYNTNYIDAEYIIAYTNETKDKYNELKMKHLNLNFGDVGCRVICKSNELRELNIFNNFIYNIKSNFDGQILLDDGVDEIIINHKQFFKHFKPAYAITLYCVQGDSIKSYHYPEEDYKFIDNRRAYTLISRLKNKKA